MRHRRNRSAHLKKPVDVTLNMNVRVRGNDLVCLFGYLQDSGHWDGWNYRSVSLRKARELEAEGKANPVVRKTDAGVQIVGYKMLVPMRLERPSPTTLTMATSRAVSGEYHGGRSGDRPTAREFDHLVKFTCWPLVGDSKAVAVRPRQTEQERQLALDLVGANGTDAQKAAERMIERGALAKVA